MTVESATYLDDLNTSYPDGSHQKAEGDNHIRLLKTVLQNTFPNANAAINPTPAEFNLLVGHTGLQPLDADLTAIAALATAAYGRSLLTAASAAAARALLGAVIGTDVQAYDADLAAIAALAKTDGNFIVGNGSAWVAESGSTARTSLGLGSVATESTVPVAKGGTGGTTIPTGMAGLGRDYKAKTSDQSKTTDTTLAADSALVTGTLTAAKLHKVDIWLRVVSASADPDLRFDLSFSQTPQARTFQSCQGNALGSGTVFQSPFSTYVAFSLTAGTEFYIHITGCIITHATLGSTLSVRWCQDNSSATATTVKAGSYMIVEQLN